MTASVENHSEAVPSDRTRQFAWRAGLVILYCYTLSAFVPWDQQITASDLDASWLAVLHWAHLHHADFGREIVFTYGPWGFAVQGFLPGTFSAVVGVWTLLATAFFAGALVLARELSPSRLKGFGWLTFFIALTPAATAFADIKLFATTWLLLVLRFFTNRSRGSRAAEIFLVVSMALASLMKFSIACAAGGVILVIAVQDLSARRAPKLAIVYAAAFLAFWLAAGQSIVSLLPWLRHSILITRGYSEAEASRLPTEAHDVTLFLTVAVLLSVAAAAAILRRQRRVADRFFGLAAILVILFALFKAGFVRHDIHEIIASASLPLIALAISAAAWPTARAAGQAILLSLCIGGIFYSNARNRNFGYPSASSSIADSLVLLPDRVAEAGRWLRNSQSVPRPSEIYLRILRDSSLPKITGSADLVSWQQIWIAAGQFDYHPRPVFQDYLAYTGELARLNADFLRGTDAPENILFNIEPIDSHLPTQEDNLAWPILLSNYDPAGLSGRWQILRRSISPRQYATQPLQNLSAHLGQWISIPKSADPVWAVVDIRRNFKGDLLNFFYKPPPLSMRIKTEDGIEHVFRFLRQSACSGFLISPVIRSCDDFAELIRSPETQSRRLTRAVSFQIESPDPSGSACFDPDFSVGFFALHRSGQIADTHGQTPALPGK